MPGHVRELHSTSNIANGINFPVRGSQPSINDNAFRRILDTGGIEVEIIQIGLTSRGQQQMAPFNHITIIQAYRHPVAGFSDTFDLHARADIDTFSSQAMLHHRGQLLIIVGQ